MGRVDNEFRIIVEHWGWDVRQLRAPAGPCPRRPMPSARPAWATAQAPQTDPLTPCRLRPELTLVITDSAAVGFPLAWARGPDPQCGRRVSIRPQPKMAPRGEVMALGPSWWGGSSDQCPSPPATCPRPPVACHKPFRPMARGPRG